MAVHPDFAAMVAEAVRVQNPKATQREIDFAVAGVAASDAFRDLAHFLTRDLAEGMYALALASEAQKISAAAAKFGDQTSTAPSPQRQRPRDPVSWLGQHYTEQAGERANIEAVAREKRVAAGGSALDRLTHDRTQNAPLTKAERKREPAINTAGLDHIVDPERRLEEFRRRSHASKSRQTLELERAAYEAKALDKTLDPVTRVAANTELARVLEALKKLDA